MEKEKLVGIKSKGKNFIDEFKSFILKGNVMDMAIGVIIGTAFANIVKALTDDFINPLNAKDSELVMISFKKEKDYIYVSGGLSETQ